MDGGAFPDVACEQFPLSLGRSRPAYGTFSELSRLVLAGLTPVASEPSTSQSMMVVQSAGTQLATRQFSADELRRADRAAVDEEQRRTRAAINAKLSGTSSASRQRVATIESQTGQQRSVAIVDQRRDPLDPKRPAVQKIAQTVVEADGPIVRSPTKKPASASAASDFKLPAAVKSWTNPKNLLISVEKREAADGRNYIDRDMSESHSDLAAAMRAAEQEVSEEAAARESAEQQRRAEQQLADERRLEEKAREAVHHGGGGEAGAGASRGQLLQRRREEAEMRDRVREERLNQRRIAKTAERLGIDVAAVSSSEVLRQQVLDSAPVTEAGQLDPRLQYAKGSRANATDDADEEGGTDAALYSAENMFGASSTGRVAVDVAAINREIAVQEAMGATRENATLGSIEDLDEQPQRRQPPGRVQGAGFDLDDLV